jgi:hypothetical protein
MVSTVATGVDIGVKVRLAMMPVAAGFLSVAIPAANAAKPAPVKPAAAKPAPLPATAANPFSETAPELPITGDMPDLARLDFAQMSRLLYAHLLADADPARSGLIIEAALQRAGKECRQINDFQIYRYRTGSRTLKVKCPGKPLYVMTVGNAGGFQISGGDGTIPELQTTDGRIYSLFGREIHAPKAGTPLAPGSAVATGSSPGLSSVTPLSSNPASPLPQVPTPAPTPAVAPGASPAAAVRPTPVPVQNATAAAGIEPKTEAQQKRFRSWLLVINGAAVGLLTLGVWGYLRSRRSIKARDWGLSSDDKDLLLDESREIYPGIFLHPQGFFLSRGRRGKRRLFRGALTAILYRDFGVKIGEIQI